MKQPIAAIMVSTTVRGDGSIAAAYIAFRDDPVARTEELVEDTFLADYNDADELVGIEILDVISMTQLMDLVDRSNLSLLRTAIERGTPKELVRV